MLHVVYSFPFRIGVPGIGMTAWHQVSGLVGQGVKVSLYCGSCERPIAGVHRLVETLKCGGIKIPYRFLGMRRANTLHDKSVARDLQRLSSPVDIVHCWPGGSLETLKAAKRLGVHTFLERQNCHTAYAFESVAAEHRKIGLAMPRGYTHAYDSGRLTREEAEFSEADTLLCPSEFVAGTFRSRGFTDSQLARHQYGYDPTLFSCNGEQPATRRFLAAFVGRCEPRKGLHYALQAWHNSGAAEVGRFAICGSFMEGYRELLGPLLDHPSIEMTGFVSDPERIMQQSEVLFLPAIEEGSALVTYEARGAGCVLAVSSASGAVGRPDIDILVHPVGDVDKLTSQFTSLLEDRARLNELRDASIATTDELTWAAAAKRLVACYQQPGERN